MSDNEFPSKDEKDKRELMFIQHMFERHPDNVLVRYIYKNLMIYYIKLIGEEKGVPFYKNDLERWTFRVDKYSFDSFVSALLNIAVYLDDFEMVKEFYAIFSNNKNEIMEDAERIYNRYRKIPALMREIKKKEEQLKNKKEKDVILADFFVSRILVASLGSFHPGYDKDLDPYIKKDGKDSR